MCKPRATHLFDGDGDSDGVDGALNLHPLLLVTAHHQRSQKELFAAPRGGRGRGGDVGVAHMIMHNPRVFILPLKRFIGTLLTI